MNKEATDVESLSAKLESKITLNTPQEKKENETLRAIAPESNPSTSDDFEPNAGNDLKHSDYIY